MKLFAPEIDNIIEYDQVFQEIQDHEIRAKWLAIYQTMDCIVPGETDEIRTIWFEVPRGPINKFGNFRHYLKEGEVNTYEEFEALWKDYYPKESQWYSFTTSTYEEKKYFFLNSKQIFTYDAQERLPEHHNLADVRFRNFPGKLLKCLDKEISKLKKNPEQWNLNLENHLSFDKRFGRIKRDDFLNIRGNESERLDIKIGAEGIEKLSGYVRESLSPDFSAFIPSMTADDFFRYCEIAYEANNYFQGNRRGLSAREKYSAMADGRDDGLREIKGDSPKAFQEWFINPSWRAGHPWEICRGGNSTHISMYVSPEGNQWKLTLAGSSIVRIEETVRIALAFLDQKVPFYLRDGEEILRMVTGSDYIGIVPDYRLPVYCHGLFPKEDRIIDFMNLDREDEDQIIPLAYWYPLEKVLAQRVL